MAPLIQTALSARPGHPATLRRLVVRGWHSQTLRILLGCLLVWLYLGVPRLRLHAPLALWQDHTVILMQARIFLEGGWSFSSGALGYPVGLNLLDFPFTDITQRLILFITTRLTGEVVAGVNLYLLCVAAANVAAGTLATEAYVRRPGLALAGGVAFGLLPVFTRAASHDMLVGFYPAALAFLLLRNASLTSSCRLTAFFRRPATLLGCAIVAASGFYYSFFALMLWSFTACALALQAANWRRLLPFGLLMTVTLTMLAALLCWQILGANPGQNFPSRSFAEQPLYAARLADLLLVLDPLHLLRGLAQGYAGFRPQTEGWDFWPGPVLSLVGLVACLFAPILARRTGSGAHPQLRPALLAWMVFCLLFAVPFGLGLLFNVLVSPEIRAQGRLGPYFGFAVLVVFLWQASRVMRWLRGRYGSRLGNGLVGAALVMAFVVNGHANLWLLPRLQQLAAPDARSEGESVAMVLAAARTAGVTTVLQLPVLPWPEAPVLNGFDPYRATIPYILSPRGSPLRWSAGLTWERPELFRLHMAEREPACLPSLARGLGFEAVLLDRRAYTAERLEALETGFQAAGMRILAEAGPRRFFQLPAVPMPCTQPTIETGKWLTAADADGVFSEGWHPGNEPLRWGRGATQRLTLRVGGLSSAAPSLSLRLMTLPEASGQAPSISIEAGARQLALLRPARPMQPEDFRIPLPVELADAAGVLELVLRQVTGPLPASRVNAVDGRLLGVGIIALRLDVATGQR